MICTELLYQPLTLLDCLHTFCGACLKEWFRFQAAKAEKAPTPPSPEDAIFTCPSCRSPVRDTKHNATVVTLLDMYVAANPAKARSEADKKEMVAKYKRGDQVLPKVNIRERTADERRADEEDRRLMNEVREMSLRDATPGQTSLASSRRHRQGRSVDARPMSNRHQNSESRRRVAGDAANPSHSEDSSRQGSDNSAGERDRRRTRRSNSRQRQVEHQTSLRSLIGSTEMSERDIEREIEDFARQIQEEGLLDGLDLDNIDLTRDDELSRRLTEAYRRRQRERTRNESSQRNIANSNTAASRSPDTIQPETRLRTSENGSRSRAGSRSTNGNALVDDWSRPPLAAVSANLEVRDYTWRPRRRTASGGRSATTPLFPSMGDARLATQSQTNPVIRSQTSDPAAPRQSFSESRSASSQSVPVSSRTVGEVPSTSTGNNASFASRVPQWNPNATHSPTAMSAPEPAPSQPSKLHLPTELAIVHSAVSTPLSSPTASSGHRRTRSQLYPEPSISCSRCNKQHIEYELHYNCPTCAGGQWNICLDCYRSGKGCQYWFGFGYGAWSKWEKMQQQGEESLAMPHMLTASRYLAPPSTPGGADGRRTLTTDAPSGRLETGTFCARCFACTNDCYWRCDVCNEGDWGFCNDCVNQGRSCTHMLLPLTHEAQQETGRPRSPRSPGRPPTATIYTGPQAENIGSFKPLIFRTRCDVCQDPIPPSHVRYHCFSCTSALVPDAPPGDYDICSPCYNNLVLRSQISSENGHSGWRRCLNGHRMVVIGFTEGRIGQWRFIERDIAGGRVLRSESFDSPEHGPQELQKWSWRKGHDKWERLVTRDVSATAPVTVGSNSFVQTFPPDGGVGLKANSRWAWYPQAGSEDELLFPKGAEIQEIEDVNGDWFFGTYMGAKGLFPAPYVRLG
ncbi:hypothetical protein QQS21_009817 [Conoideocrella luteorostrata]|uniref:RING-type domain-containing protein n=1 Tax=Conoideocrella luteorostrata TaxID=1105319 RepID=A0AAJ0CH64_9HYPO|nr:hypothetical protein QQS21_009817 [Conoideocrella luteorostrata]